MLHDSKSNTSLVSFA